MKFKYPDPYLVLGTGRSGTSTVARIFHNKLGVFMGHQFPPTNETNPDGFWEDMDFYRANKSFVMGQISFPVWRKKVWTTILMRRALNKPWGFKESRMGHLIGLYVGFFDNPRIVWCQREKDLVIASLQRCYGHDKKRAYALWRTREKTIDRILRNTDHLVIYFNKKRKSDEEIIEHIKSKWKDIE